MLSLLSAAPLGLTGTYPTSPLAGSVVDKRESCFWVTVSDDSLYNWVYPDSNSVYQCSSYKLPEGATIRVSGMFPRSRYLTYTLYGAVPGNFFADQDIEPDEGSINPYRYGMDRDVPNSQRRFTLDMVSGNRPDASAPGYTPPANPNTFYHGAGGLDPIMGWFLCTRIYVPDMHTEPFGDTPLPSLTLILADGTTITDEEAFCKEVDALNKGQGLFAQAIGFDLEKYLAGRDGSRFQGMNRQTYVPGANPLNLPVVPEQYPASNPPLWRAFFNGPHQHCVFFEPDPADPDGPGGPAPGDITRPDCEPNGPVIYNPDGLGLGNPAGRYVETWIDQGFGRVVYFKAKMPRVPKTWHNNKDVPCKEWGTSTKEKTLGKPYCKDYDLRYFSICPQESQATWRVGDCIFDEELAESEDDEGYYHLVMTRPSFRPRNARPECGYVWAPTPAAGDGAGDMWLSNIWIRHALPSEDFKEAAQNIQKPGTEMEVLGDYYPKGSYHSVEEFEALGCNGLDFKSMDPFPGCSDRCCEPGEPNKAFAGEVCHPDVGCVGGFDCTCISSSGTSHRLLFASGPHLGDTTCYCLKDDRELR